MCTSSEVGKDIMGRPGKSKEDIVSCLGKAFRRYGYEGASLSRLTEETGLERASLYHHFPKGKVDMAEAVLLTALESLDTEVVNQLRTDEVADLRLKRMLRSLEAFYDAGKELCFITIFSLAPMGSTSSKKMNDIVSGWTKLLEKALKEVGVSNPRSAAEMAIATIQGGLVLAYNMENTALFKRCLLQLKFFWGV